MSETLPIVRKSLILPVSADAAFETFTGKLQDWWPVESHSLSASEGARPLEVLLAPQLGGKITERRHNGDLSDWATITAWEPGQRISLDWYVGRSPSEATQIDVRFIGTADGGTEVRLTHAGFERLGAAGEAAAANYDEGWDLVLGERFRHACESA